MLVRAIVEKNARFHGDREAVVETSGRVRTWAELDERSNQLAHALLELGLAKGDRLAMYSANCAEYLEFFFACAKTGIIGQALNARLLPHELVDYVRHVGPRALLVGPGFAQPAAELTAHCPSVEHTIHLGASATGFAYEDLLAAHPTTDPGCVVDESDPYQICGTSGTTGRLKGAVLTNHNATSAILLYAAEMPVRYGDTNLQSIPYFFNSGGPASLPAVFLRAGRTILPPAFDPAGFARAIEEHAVTYTTLVPTMLTMVLELDDIDSYDFSSLRTLIMGGSPLSRDLLVRGRRVFGNVFYAHYGMTESYSTGSTLRPENQHPDGTEEEIARLSSAGLPMASVDVRVVDADGNDVPRDGVTAGEVWLTGDAFFKEYWGLPEETAAAYEGRWFKSGDLAVVDAEGYFTIVDRAKDIIISGGINVFSREVEEVLLDHEGIAQAAVIGVPDDRWGERVHAILVRAKGADELTEEDVLAHTASRLADYKRPRSVEFRTELPISGTGKILKRELRKPYWEGRDRQV